VSVTSCYNCDTDVFRGLTVQQYQTGIDWYDSVRWQVINRSGKLVAANPVDSMSCWYSLETLKRYICLIERYSDSLNISPDKLGIRFHYAVYKDPVVMEYGRNYTNLHTLFLTPTMLIDSSDVDFDPRYTDVHLTAATLRSMTVDSMLQHLAIQRLDRSVMPLVIPYFNPKTGLAAPSTFAATGAAFATATTSGGVTVMGQNQGQLCPPTCPNP
jgi:hypothetical protein